LINNVNICCHLAHGRRGLLAHLFQAGLCHARFCAFRLFEFSHFSASGTGFYLYLDLLIFNQAAELRSVEKAGVEAFLVANILVANSDIL
jgi:hypothetical protein